MPLLSPPRNRLGGALLPILRLTATRALLPRRAHGRTGAATGAKRSSEDFWTTSLIKRLAARRRFFFSFSPLASLPPSPPFNNIKKTGARVAVGARRSTARPRVAPIVAASAPAYVPDMDKRVRRESFEKGEKRGRRRGSSARSLSLALSTPRSRPFSCDSGPVASRSRRARPCASRRRGRGPASRRGNRPRSSFRDATLFATQLSSRRSSLRDAALVATQLSSRRSSLRDAALFSSFRLDVVSSSSSFFGSPLSFPCSTSILSRNKKHRTR